MLRLLAVPAFLAVLLPPSVAGMPAASSARAAPRSATVTLKDIAFRPARVTIRRGGSVRFRWDDGRTQHDVTSTGRRRFPRSPTQSHGTYAVRLRTTGTYRYVCTIHFGMRGTIVVR